MDWGDAKRPEDDPAYICDFCGHVACDGFSCDEALQAIEDYDDDNASEQDTSNEGS
jgi:hypothetical protein